MRSTYCVLLTHYSLWIRKVQREMNDRSLTGYDEYTHSILIPFYKEEIERFTAEREDLIEMMRKQHQNRPLWKKLLHRV